MEMRRDLIVIVDDDQAVRDALQFALRLEGFCVHVHGSAVMALNDPDLRKACCVVINEHSRHSDGFALLDSLHAFDSGLPAIMLTSHATLRMRERAQRVGVREVLEKPLLDDALLRSIRDIIADRPAADT